MLHIFLAIFFSGYNVQTTTLNLHCLICIAINILVIPSEASIFANCAFLCVFVSESSSFYFFLMQLVTVITLLWLQMLAKSVFIEFLEGFSYNQFSKCSLTFRYLDIWGRFFVCREVLNCLGLKSFHGRNLEKHSFTTIQRIFLRKIKL